MIRNFGVRSRLVLGCLVLVALAATPLLLRATTTPVISVTVTNSSNREIRHFYLSPSNEDNWGPDQLNNSTISAGGSHTFSNLSCEATNIKLVAEDQDGCFITKIVSCSENSAWTITNETARDCGN